jgi:hypothetical protein
LVGSDGNAQSTVTDSSAIGGEQTYVTPLSSDTFTATLNVTGGQIQNITTNYEADAIAPVPGPLPILGAGAAFGLSRKLRQRIKAAG